jgi:hypothetical protein
VRSLTSLVCGLDDRNDEWFPNVAIQAVWSIKTRHSLRLRRASRFQSSLPKSSRGEKPLPRGCLSFCSVAHFASKEMNHLHFN